LIYKGLAEIKSTEIYSVLSKSHVSSPNNAWSLIFQVPDVMAIFRWSFQKICQCLMLSATSVTSRFFTLICR
jgi:hypothetical protein